jgi:hypothetical protein
MSSLQRFPLLCGCVFFPAKPNTKCLGADMQLLIINILCVCWLEDSQRAETFCADKQYKELFSLKVTFR